MIWVAHSAGQGARVSRPAPAPGRAPLVLRLVIGIAAAAYEQDVLTSGKPVLVAFGPAVSSLGR